MNIAIPVGLVLGVTLLAGSFAFGASKFTDRVEDAIEKNQQHLQSVENKPLVFEEKVMGDCKVSYIETSHQNSVGKYEQDLYLKSNCANSTSITKVQQRINTSRMKLAENQNVDLKKNTKL